MHIAVKGFGPIRDADIEVKPLTVFVGSNAAGKSYLLYLIWSLLYVEPDWNALTNILSQHLTKIFENITNKDIVSSELRGIYVDFLKNFESIFARNFELLLKDTFMVSDIRELIHKDFDLCEVVIYDNDDEPAIRITIDRKSENIHVDIKEDVVQKIEKRLGVNAEMKGSTLLISFYDVSSARPMYAFTLFTDDLNRSLSMLAASIPFIVIAYLGYCPYIPVAILPDGRAGILRTMDPLARSLLSVRWRETPMINAVDREFVKLMSALGPRIKNRSIAEIASFVEKSLRYRFEYSVEMRRIVVFDDVRGIQLDIVRAPSGLRELAPLILLMKYILDEGYILVVEEPEAHLHPDAQSVIARALAMLSKKNVYVVFTTHSVHVLDELHALLRISKLNSEQKKELGYLEDEGLDPEDVAIYMVSEDGSVIRAEVSHEGIEETFIDRVYRELANRYARIEQLLERPRG